MDFERGSKLFSSNQSQRRECQRNDHGRHRDVAIATSCAISGALPVLIKSRAPPCASSTNAHSTEFMQSIVKELMLSSLSINELRVFTITQCVVLWRGAAIHRLTCQACQFTMLRATCSQLASYAQPRNRLGPNGLSGRVDGFHMTDTFLKHEHSTGIHDPWNVIAPPSRCLRTSSLKNLDCGCGVHDVARCTPHPASQPCPVVPKASLGM